MANTFVITPGENKSIGLEVTLRSLESLKANNKDIYIFFAQKKSFEKHLKDLNIDLSYLEVDSLAVDLKPGFYVLFSEKAPVDWFKDAVDFCDSNPLSAALITGPLKKASFGNTESLGHTDFLRKRFKPKSLFMTFFGEHYNCLLLNDHIPLEEVNNNIDITKLENMSDVLKPFKLKDKVALLGVNPHAGEDGLIGSIEESVHKKFVENKNDRFKGPLPADGFFSVKDYQKFPFIVANYHDQGLIPFKLIHGFKGSQATLGLPFIRTSVDHGTADDLFLKSEANHESMLDALHLAHKLLKLKQEKAHDL